MKNSSADFTGTWTGEVDDGGATHPATIILKQNGDTVTGTAGTNNPAEISDGKVDGDTATFSVIRKMSGNMREAHYTVKLSGDQMHVKRELLVNDTTPPVTAEFTLTRS